MFILKALNFYEINENNCTQLPQIIEAFNYNHIRSDFQCVISDIKKINYNKIFNNFEFLGYNGFPIF